MASIAIYADEILSRAAELCSSSNATPEYKDGVRDLVARVVYPELSHDAAAEFAGTRIHQYIREGR
jgi:hypothetical protein